MMEMNEITGTEASQSWVVAGTTWPQEMGVSASLSGSGQGNNVSVLLFTSNSSVKNT